MRAETGQALLAATGHLSGTGPSLSTLVGRIAAGHGLTVTGTPPAARAAPTPHPAEDDVGATGAGVRLVSVPPADRQLPGGGRLMPTTDGRPGGMALLAAHGGAGVSSLLRAGLATAGAVDAQRRWPANGRVLLLARTSTGGLEWARDLARQHASGHAGPGVELVGLVLVADAPGRLPARIGALADLVCGAFVCCWQVPWLTEWRLAAVTEPLPVHPEVARLTADVHAMTAEPTATVPAPPADPTRSSRPVPSRGALL